MSGAKGGDDRHSDWADPYEEGDEREPQSDGLTAKRPSERPGASGKGPQSRSSNKRSSKRPPANRKVSGGKKSVPPSEPRNAIRPPADEMTLGAERSALAAPKTPSDANLGRDSVAGSMAPIARTVPPGSKPGEKPELGAKAQEPEGKRGWVAPAVMLAAAGVAVFFWYQNTRTAPSAADDSAKVQAAAPRVDEAIPGGPNAPREVAALAPKAPEAAKLPEASTATPPAPAEPALQPPVREPPVRDQGPAQPRMAGADSPASRVGPSGGWEPWEKDDTDYSKLRGPEAETPAKKAGVWNPWDKETDYSKFRTPGAQGTQPKGGRGDMAARIRDGLGVSAANASSPAAAKGGETEDPTGPGPAITGPQPFDTLAANGALQNAVALATGCRQIGDPSGIAKVAVTFSSRTGRVTQALVQGPPFAGTATGGCIATKLRSASVPPFAGDNVTVSKTVVIQ